MIGTVWHHLQQAWHHLMQTQPAPPRSVVLLTAAAALLAVMIRQVWRPLRRAVTIAHEAGHALTAVLCGRRLQSITLHSDTSGLTLTRGRATGPGVVLTLLAGYPAPAVLGAAGAALLAWRHVTMFLWVGIALLAAVLLLIRNAYGVLSVLLVAAVLVATAGYAPARVQAVVAYFAVWLMLFGAVRPIFELGRARRRGRVAHSDVDQLAAATRVPAVVWLGVMLVLSVGALGLSLLTLGLLRAPAHL